MVIRLSADVLRPEAVRLGLTAAGMTDAIIQCGRVLMDIQAVEQPYIAAMVEREEGVSTFVGRGVAIPHGTDTARQYVRRTAVAVLQFPDGVDWNGDPVSVCVAIAAAGDEHVGLMSALAQLLLDEGQAHLLRTATDPGTVLGLLRLDKPAAVETTQPVRAPSALRRPNSVHAGPEYTRAVPLDHRP